MRGVRSDEIAEAINVALLPPLAGSPTGSWALVRGRKAVAFAVVLAVHASEAFAVPVPDRVCITLLNPLVNLIVPEAGPGESKAGANVTLNDWL